MGLVLPQRTRRIATAAFLSGSLLMLGACSAEDSAQIRRLAMPEPASEEAPVIYDLWQGAWLAAIIVGVVVWGLIAYAVIRYRRRSEDEIPVQTRYNLPIEIFYTVAPVIMMVVFFFFTVEAQDKVLANPTPERTITVVGQQWSWTFNYAQDAEPAEDDTENWVHFVGTPAEAPTLVLPVGEKVRINLRSPDVIHSFWVPAFLFKMDIVPGRDNYFTLTPSREGTFAGKCAELCGAYHSRMLFNVDVVSPEKYEAYVADLESQGNTGLLLGGADAENRIGLDDEYNTGDDE